MWNHDPEDILRSESPNGRSHSYTHSNVAGSGNRRDSFDILHSPNHCPECDAYRVHVVYACLQDGDDLIQDWTGERPGYTTSNLGFSPDHIRQELREMRTHLRRVIRERDDAIALNACHRSEVALLENQLREVKDRLLATEMTYNDETQLWNTDLLGEESRRDELFCEEAEQDDGFETLFPRNDSPDALLGIDGWTTEHPNIQTANDIFSDESWNDSSDDFDLFQQLRLMIQEDENPWEDDSPSEALQKSPQANSALEPYCADSSSESASPSTSSLSLSGSDWAGSQSDDSASSPVRPTSSNGELHQTLTLMAAAHESGNTTALVQIKKLIIQSEKTPRHKRTEAQKYLLLKWRSPSSTARNNQSDLAPTQPQPAHSLPSQNPEIFVDASGSGIGFVFGAQWLAWRFKKSRKIPLGGDGKIVMSWAELLAVEVGLRTLIEAGYRSIAITVRSDNTGVIDALKKKSWCPRHGLQDILQNILNLCREHKINLRPRWVSTKDNLADKPSRGVYPPRSLSFEFPPKLPERFLDLLELAVPATT